MDRRGIFFGVALGVAVAFLPLQAPVAAAAEARAMTKADWYLQAAEVARQFVRRQFEPADPLELIVPGNRLTRVPTGPRPGESTRTEGGNVVTWTSADCYYTAPQPTGDPSASMRLWLPKCKRPTPFSMPAKEEEELPPVELERPRPGVGR